MNYQHSPVIHSPVIGLQSSYPASISSHHFRGSECRLPSHYSPGSEHSFAHELPNPATSSRMILPLEPDFLQISDPSGIIEPPNTWRSNDKHSSQTRQSRMDQSKRRHRSKKKRRHRSSSSSSRSASSKSHKNKKSKRTKHSHKKRRRQSMSSSSSSSASTQSENDYGRYKKVKLAPQVAETPIPLQPAEQVNITQSLPEIPINITPQLPDNMLQAAKDFFVFFFFFFFFLSSEITVYYVSSCLT